jgi:probable phosphoglycerate mutase
VRRLILVRHGETDWNAAHRLQGASDVPLNENGRAQARAAAPVLASIAPVKTIVASDLSRAQETAHIIADAMGADVVTDARLRERSYGVWEGLPEDVRRAEHGEEHTRWEQGLEPIVEGYEGHDSVAERALAAVADDVTGAGTHMLVAHGSTIRVLICALLGMELGSRAIATLGNVHWAELENATADDAPGNWVLRHLNAAGDTVLA